MSSNVQKFPILYFQPQISFKLYLSICFFREAALFFGYSQFFFVQRIRAFVRLSPCRLCFLFQPDVGVNCTRRSAKLPGKIISIAKYLHNHYMCCLERILLQSNIITLVYSDISICSGGSWYIKKKRGIQLD